MDKWFHSRISLKGHDYGVMLGQIKGVSYEQQLGDSVLMRVGLNIVMYK
jgi:hypothetical protein